MNWPTDWKFLLDWIAPAAALVIAVVLHFKLETLSYQML